MLTLRVRRVCLRSDSRKVSSLRESSQGGDEVAKVPESFRVAFQRLYRMYLSLCVSFQGLASEQIFEEFLLALIENFFKHAGRP